MRVAGLLVCACGLAPAQPRALTGAVERIGVAGFERISPAVLLSATVTRTGAAYSADSINSDLHRGMRLGLFANVTAIARQRSPSTVAVTYRVRELPVVSSFSLTRAHPEQGSLKKLFTTREGGPFDPYAWKRDLERIRAFLASNDHHGVSIQEHTSMSPDGRSVALTVHVREGQPQHLEAIDVRGARMLDAGEVRSSLHCQPRSFWLLRDGRFDDARLEEDAEALRERYREAGCQRAQVAITRRTGSRPGLAILDVEIDEGPRYVVQSLSWVQRVVESNTFAEVIDDIDDPSGQPWTPGLVRGLGREIAAGLAGRDAGPVTVNIASHWCSNSTPETVFVDLVARVLPSQGRRTFDAALPLIPLASPLPLGD
ncbi:hypothetical protein GX586_06785 [bacterium]|nr:hypothetical protein [bacterium]